MDTHTHTHPILIKLSEKNGTSPAPKKPWKKSNPVEQKKDRNEPPLIQKAMLSLLGEKVLIPVETKKKGKKPIWVLARVIIELFFTLYYFPSSHFSCSFWGAQSWLVLEQAACGVSRASIETIGKGRLYSELCYLWRWHKSEQRGAATSRSLLSGKWSQDPT